MKEQGATPSSWVGEHCDLCDKPQWVLPDGSHVCATFPELQAENARLRARVERLERIRKAANCVVIAAKRDRWPEHGYLKALLEALQESDGASQP